MSRQAVLLGLLAVAAAAQCLAIEEVPAEETLEARPLGDLLQSFTNDPACKNRETTCSADCRGLFHCSNMGNGIWVPLNPSMSKCPAAKPYCTSEGDEAFCTATPPPSTGGTCTPSSEPLPTGTYNCAADGYWPDLTSCTRYYLCVGNNAYRFDCSAFPGTVYDQRTTRCVPKGRGTCATLSCNHFRLDKPVEYHVYTPAPWIFAVCNSRDASTALVSACPSQRQTKDQTTGECVERCDQEGRFLPLGGADGGTNFVDCVSLGGSKLSAPTPGVCPPGTTFSAALGRCTV